MSTLKKIGTVIYLVAAIVDVSAAAKHIEQGNTAAGLAFLALGIVFASLAVNRLAEKGDQ